MTAKKKKPKVLRGMPGSTEAAARVVLKKHLTKKKPRLTKDTGGRTTATSPKGVRKTPAQGKKSLAAMRAAQARKVAAAKRKKK